GIEYASMAVVTLALPARRDPALPGSGLPVPAVAGRTVKAASFSVAQWAWAASAFPHGTLLRAPKRRDGGVATLQRDDEELTATALAEVGAALGTTLPSPVASHGRRWGGGLPQYDLGHTDRIAAAREDVAVLPGLELAGAAYDGI